MRSPLVVFRFAKVTVTLIVGVILTLAFASAQTISKDDLFMPHRWDGAHGVVFFGKGLLRQDNRPIRSYEDGTSRGAPINIFSDFPHARKAVVDDFAAGADGKTLIAVVLNFGSTLRHVILTYASSGKLVSVLDTEPYYAQAIATDDAGNIYTLGNKLNESKADSQPYPLLVVYDSAGRIVKEGLYSTVFKKGSRAVNQSEDSVDPSLMVRDGKLFVHAPLENEILVCLEDATILRRVGLGVPLARIREREGMTRVALKNVAFVDENRVVLDVVGYSGSDKAHLTQDSAIMHPAAYLLNLNTGQTSVMLRGQMPEWNFLGVKANQLLMLTPTGGQHSAITHEISNE